jgi:hypothetical protein
MVIYLLGRFTGLINYSTPQLVILISAFGFPIGDPCLSIILTTSIPFVAFPKTTCFPFNQGVSPTQIKNYNANISVMEEGKETDGAKVMALL